MELNNYQYEAIKTAEYPCVGTNLVYPAMGLVGEAGEVCDKVKKRWRNTGKMSAHDMPQDERNEIVKELGDVLWYISACASELGIHLNTVAQVNLDKLNDRRNRGVIKSSGDNR